MPEINQLTYILRRLECNVPLAVDRAVFYENRCNQLEKLIVDLINGQTPHDGILKVDPDNTPFYIFKTRENTNLFIKKRIERLAKIFRLENTQDNYDEMTEK